MRDDHQSIGLSIYNAYINIMALLKRCSTCSRDLPQSEFHKMWVSKDGLSSRCKTCTSKIRKEQALKRKAEEEAQGIKPAGQNNKHCGKLLGEAEAEKAIQYLFGSFRKMPSKNPGYGYLSGNGDKIDIKSSCRRHPKLGNDYWSFKIDKNEIADYFLLLAFDSPDNFNSEHIWLVPGSKIGNKSIISIPVTRIHWWEEYEKPLDEVLGFGEQAQK